MTEPRLTLISHKLCPFVQRAAAVLAEKQVAFERIDIDLSAKPDWFLAISPTGKVPMLRVRQDDGSEVNLFESVPICEYLDETQGDIRLHPEDPLVRAEQRAWIEFGTSILQDAWPFLNATDAETADAKASAMHAKLARLETVLGDGPYFEGARFGMVDAVFAPIFRWFDTLDGHDFGAIFGDLPRVDAWRRALRDRPSVRAAAPSDFAERLQDHLRSRGALLAA